MTPEEQALAIRAREETEKRAAVRRVEAGDISDLLGSMLGVPGPDPESESGPADSGRHQAPGGGPSVNVVLARDDRSDAPPAPFAPFAEAAEANAGQFRPRRTSPAPAVPAGEGAAPLSPAMAAVLENLLSLGGPPLGRRLSFEDEGAAANYTNTMTMLARGRRHRAPELAFEPEEAAAGAESGKRTMMLSRDELARVLPAKPPDAGADPPSPTPEYSLDDLPGTPGPPPGRRRADEDDEVVGEAELSEGELAGADLLATPTSGVAQPDAGGPAPDGRDYGLDDLPEVSPRSAAPRADGAGDAGPEMSEVVLDERGLDAALADADRLGTSGAAGGAGPGTPPPELPGPREKTYGLEDLPAAPASGGSTPPPSGEAAPSGDRISEVTMPDFAFPGEVSSGPPVVPSTGFTAVERAVEAKADPSGARKAGAGREAPVPAAAPEQLAVARNAAELSVQQLADVEQFLERQIDEAARDGRARVVVQRSGLLGRVTRLSRYTAAAIGRLAGRLIVRADGRLERYCLSCKILLGFAGIIILAVVGALSYRTWLIRL
jgi:hypothetical protein